MSLENLDCDGATDNRVIRKPNENNGKCQINNKHARIIVTDSDWVFDKCRVIDGSAAISMRQMIFKSINAKSKSFGHLMQAVQSNSNVHY